MNIESVIDYLIGIILLIIPVLMGLAVLVFLWGIVVFISHAGDEKKIEEGKQLIVWGLVGLFVIFALWSIVGYIQTTLNLSSASSLGTLSAQPNTIPVP